MIDGEPSGGKQRVVEELRSRTATAQHKYGSLGTAICWLVFHENVFHRSGCRIHNHPRLVLGSTVRIGPTRPPALPLLPVRAPLDWQAGRPAYAASATVCCRERRDTFRSSTTAVSSDDVWRRAATARSHFPRGTRPRSLRWRRYRRSPGVLSSGRVD